MLSVRRLAVVVTVMVAFVAAAARAQVLKQVPSDAIVVFKINNLQATSGKIASLAKQFGIDQIVAPLADPLAYAQEQFKWTKGLNTKGEAALVMLNPKRGTGPGYEAMVMLVPTSDYAAFLTNFEAPKTDGAVTEVTMPMDGGTSYCAQWGDYAALSPVKEIVATKPTSFITVTGLSAQEMDKKDAAIYVNFSELRGMALPAMKQNRTMILNQVTQAIKQQRAMMTGGRRGSTTQPSIADAAQSAAMMKTFVNHGLDIAEGFMTNTDSAVFGLDLGGQGIKTTTLVQFVPDTYPAKLAGKMKNTTSSMLTGLPSSKYLAYYGLTLDPAVTTQIISDATGPIIPDLEKAGENGKTIAKVIDLAKRLFAASTGGSAGWVSPGGQAGMGSLFQMITVSTGDAQKFRECQIEMMKYQQSIQQMSNPGMQTDVTYTPNAKTIDGVELGHMQMKFTVTGKSPQERQAAQMIKMMYGPNGLDAYGGNVDAGHHISVTGGNDALISSTIAAVKAKSDPMGDLAGTKSVAANLPPNRFMEMYVPVDNLIAVGVTYAKQFGMPINFPLPANLPPVGITGSTEANAVRFDTYISSQLVQSMIAAGMQMFMGLQGGGAGQPGGL